MTVTILITRPEPEAARFASALRGDHGDTANVLTAPLMHIHWTGALPALSGDETLIFTSRQGVAGFCRLTARRDLPCYAVGEATAQAAREAGLDATPCGGDAAALMRRLAEDGARGPFLHPRGAHVAADIAGTLRAAGHEAAEAIVYDQQPQPLDAPAHAVLAGPAPVIVPLMSPRSGQLFFAEAPAPRAPLLIAAISRATAETVPEGAARVLRIAEAPNAAAIRNLLRDMVKSAKRLEGGKRAQ
ncbi:uroporphyrinogen-III synthase [Roseovarius sp. D22-M7]|uniref:uroporphyrinogen-III synthase n=1 Tax=Roseovarius sp. D22-M7 TaxID=3127116 RepID=UPI00300F7C86